MRIDVTDTISLDDTEIEISFIQAGGPGGQNVNKVATAAQLRFDVRNSPSLPNGVKLRLAALAGQRLTVGGVIVMTGREHRTQDRNRQEVIQRLVMMIRKASVRPARRIKTKPSHGQRQRRMDAKSHRAGVKEGRSGRIDDR